MAGVVLLVSVAAAPDQHSPTQILSADERQRLDGGEVLVDLEPVTGSAIREGIASGVIEFPVERVFRAVVDLENWDEWVPFMTAADARVLPGGEIESDQRLEFPALVGTREFRVRAVATPPTANGPRRWTVTWSYVPGSGNVAAHRGAWTLVEHAPGRTLATCRLFTDPGGVTPSWAMNGATEKMLRWMFKALRLQTNRGRYQD
jgi:uncharacterized protein YndB with AHSA1/START domain